MKMIAEYLNRNGAIAERARREGRSLSYIERSILGAGRLLAKEKGLSRERINALEMDGERDWERVFAKIKVEAVFAYYDPPFEEIPAIPHYFVRVSNHPALPESGHVDAEQITSNGQSLPKTPTYQEWIKSGSKVVRS